MKLQNLPACFVMDIFNISVSIWKSRTPRYWFFTRGWMQFGCLEIRVLK